MAHPQQQAAAVLPAGLEHRPVTVVVDPLGQFRELLRIGRFPERLGQELVEALRLLGAAREAAQRIIVQAVHRVGMRHRVHGLEGVLAHRPDQVLVIHHGRHAHLAMELVASADAEVLRGLQGVVRAAAAHAVRRGMRDIAHARMLPENHLLQERVDHLRRISFVPAHVQADGRMVADPADIFLGDRVEAVRIQRVESCQTMMPCRSQAS